MSRHVADPPFAPAASAEQVARQTIARARDEAAFQKLRPEVLAGGAKLYFHKSSLLFVAEAPSADAVVGVVTTLRRARVGGLIQFFEANRMLRAAAAPNDPFYEQQWALRTIGAEAAWQRAATQPLSAVVVAVVDSGVHKDHSDLKPHYIGGTPADAGVDENTHGTMIAGTIGAVAGNHKGVAGTFGPPPGAPIRLYSAKFFSERTVLTAYNAAIAIFDAVDSGADVINASWDVGMPMESPGLTSEALRFAVEYTATNNVVFVAAAGNDGTDNDVLLTWPACYDSPNLISVMATDEADTRPAFSNYGARSVHVAAPGLDILSTYPYRWDAQGTFAPTKYRTYSGTSAAAAHVAGAAALLRALKPGWSANEIREHLIASAEPVPWVPCVANGRLDLARAIRGPLTVTIPRAGDTWTKNQLTQVRWRSDFDTPAVQTVSILLFAGAAGAAAPTVLAQGVANDGSYTVRAPNLTIPQARLRIVSDQAPFMYDTSGVFAVS